MSDVALGARPQTRDGRGRAEPRIVDVWFVVRVERSERPRRSETRAREGVDITAPPMYVCAGKSRTRRSGPTCSLVVARGRGRLSLSPLSWSAGLYPSFPVLVRRWARICEVLRGCRPPSYRASHHSGWVTPVGTRCGICARCRRSPSLRRAASNRPQPHQRTSRWARRTGSTRVARPPRARA